MTYPPSYACEGTVAGSDDYAKWLAAASPEQLMDALTKCLGVIARHTFGEAAFADISKHLLESANREVSLIQRAIIHRMREGGHADDHSLIEFMTDMAGDCRNASDHRLAIWQDESDGIYRILCNDHPIGSGPTVRGALLAAAANVSGHSVTPYRG